MDVEPRSAKASTTAADPAGSLPTRAKLSMSRWRPENPYGEYETGFCISLTASTIPTLANLHHIPLRSAEQIYLHMRPLSLAQLPVTRIHEQQDQCPEILYV